MPSPGTPNAPARRHVLLQLAYAQERFSVNYSCIHTYMNHGLVDREINGAFLASRCSAFGLPIVQDYWFWHATKFSHISNHHYFSSYVLHPSRELIKLMAMLSETTMTRVSLLWLCWWMLQSKAGFFLMGSWRCLNWLVIQTKLYGDKPVNRRCPWRSCSGHCSCSMRWSLLPAGTRLDTSFHSRPYCLCWCWQIK